VTGTARSVPAASSAATASELSTAGPAPAATDACGEAGSMAQTLDLAGAGTVGRTDERRPFGLFKDLDWPGDVFRDLGPNWFTSVMGTGIVANAAAVLPLQVPGLCGFATAVWGWPRPCWWG
jgi:hypothetical protein